MTGSNIDEKGRSGDSQDFLSTIMDPSANRRFFPDNHTKVCHSER